MKRYEVNKGAVAENEIVMIENPDGDWVRYIDVYGEFGERCDCCGEMGHDRRTLWMGCGYEMSELDVPFTEREVEGMPGFNSKGLFTLRVCGLCRSRWMQAIEDWFKRGGK